MTVSAIYHGQVVHTRYRPVRHRLKHRMMWLLLDLDELPLLSRRLRVFSFNRFNLVDFRERDHGDGSTVPLRAQIEQSLRRVSIEPDGGAIRVQCMPRVLGTVFNPLSVFFCHRADGGLHAMLYEVNNTFGDSHVYVVPIAAPDAHRAVQRQGIAKPWKFTGFKRVVL